MSEREDSWKCYRDLKNHADIEASWWLGMNCDDVDEMALTGHVTVKWMQDCLAMFQECRDLKTLKERLTPGMTKKRYLETYVRGKE